MQVTLFDLAYNDISCLKISSSFLSSQDTIPTYLTVYDNLTYVNGSIINNLTCTCTMGKGTGQPRAIHFFFGKMIFIVCEQKNRQKNTNKCYIQHT